MAIPTHTDMPGDTGQTREHAAVTRTRYIRLRRAARVIVVLGLPLVTYGCGFEPMLAVRDNGTSVAQDFAKVRVGYIENRSGQVLRNDLLEALNPRGESTQPQYTLVIRIEEPQQNLAFQRNNSVSFVNYTVIAYWTLVDNNSGANVYSASSASSLPYAISNSQYATAVSAQDARDRVVLDISQDIRNQLAKFFVGKKGSPSKG